MNGGEVVASIDEATGGHHMTLVLAGALKMSYESAEAFKVDPGNEAIVFATIRPTLEKMATIAADALAGRDVEAIALVGGKPAPSRVRPASSPKCSDARWSDRMNHCSPHLSALQCGGSMPEHQLAA